MGGGGSTPVSLVPGPIGGGGGELPLSGPLFGEGYPWAAPRVRPDKIGVPPGEG